MDVGEQVRPLHGVRMLSEGLLGPCMEERVLSPVQAGLRVESLEAGRQVRTYCNGPGMR